MNHPHFPYGIGRLINPQGGDRGQSFPSSDADDFSNGARWIPGAVTVARREGERAEFVRKCGPCCWYWKMPDGSTIRHWDPEEAGNIARHNKRDKGDAGPCPSCGNVHTNGGTVPPGEWKAP